MSDPPRVPLPSFEEVRRELDRRVGEQERRAAAADTKAGLILGFDGILVGLSLDRDGWVFVGGQVAAAASALVALVSLWPRVSAALSVRAVRNSYLTEDVAVTRLRLLDTRIWLYEFDEARIDAKIRWLRVAVALLGVAVLVLSGAAILDSAT